VNQSGDDASREDLGGSTWNAASPENGDMHVVKASTEELTTSNIRSTCDNV